MVCTAIYMFEPPIFNSPITVNFGGKFIYEITESPTISYIKEVLPVPFAYNY